MTAIYPLRNNDDGRYLRYSLRALFKVYPDLEPIVVGGCPAWYNGKHVPHPDYTHERKEENIRDKVIAAAVDEFLFMNDDIYITKPITQAYDKGLLSETLNRRNPNGSYGRLLNNTMKYYGDVKNADIHTPMWMTGEGVKRTAFDWPMFGLGFKTCYCQENNISTVTIPDVKLDKPLQEYPPIFSTSDLFPVKHLDKLWPHHCKYEKGFIS